MLISSIDNAKIKEIKKLETKKFRDESGLFLVEGEHLVYEAYKEGLLKTLVIRDGYPLVLDVDTLYVSDKVLKYLSSLQTPAPVIGVVKKKVDRKIGEKVIALDNIQDPGNLGTIIRSAVAFNFDTVILSDDTVDLYNPKVIRATQGMIFKINIIIDNLKNILLKLKEKKYELYATDVNNGNDVKSIEKRKNFVIIMGNEGNGVSKDIKNMCSNFIYIPMNNNCESLNVAVAASIILYELK